MHQPCYRSTLVRWCCRKPSNKNPYLTGEVSRYYYHSIRTIYTNSRQNSKFHYYSALPVFNTNANRKHERRRCTKTRNHTHQQTRHIHNLTLSSMWEAIHGSQQESIYTSPSKPVSTVEYYRSHTEKHDQSQEPQVDRQFAQKLLVFNEDQPPTSTIPNSPINNSIASPGDLVECISRDGSNIAFGAVVSRFPSKSRILIYTLEGTLKSFHISTIRLRILGAFDPSLLIHIFHNDLSSPHFKSTLPLSQQPTTNFFFSSAFKETPSNQNTNQEIHPINTPEKENLLALLHMIIKASLEQYDRGGLHDAFSVVFAHAASGSVRTFTLEYLSTKALSVSRKLPRPGSSSISKALTYSTSMIAAHIWVSNSPDLWYTFPTTLNTHGGSTIIDNSDSSKKEGDGKWLPIPTVAAQDTQYVQLMLSKNRYVAFAGYIRRRVQEKYGESSRLINEMEEDEDELTEETMEQFSRILGVLKRYIVYPHPNHEHIAKIILQQVYQNSSILPNPASVHRMLIDAELIGTHNPYLDSGLILDYDQGMIIDEYTDRAEALETESLMKSDLLKFPSSHLRWPNSIPVYAFYTEKGNKHSNENTNLQEQQDYGDDEQKSIDQSQLAISIENSNTSPGKYKFHIHVPNIAAWYTPTSDIMAIGLRRARTVWLPEGIRRLFPDEVLKRVSFRSTLDSSEMEDSTHTRCLTFSVEIDSFDFTLWGPHDVSVSLTSIPNRNIQFHSLDNLSNIFQWDPANMGIVDKDVTHHDLGQDGDIFSDSGDGFITTNGDISNETWFDGSQSIPESPMGWPKPRKSNDDNGNKKTFTNFSPNKPETCSSNIEDSLSPKDYNNIDLIYSILEQNFWKRMDDTDAVYETDIEEHDKLISVGSKQGNPFENSNINQHNYSLSSQSSSSLKTHEPEFILTESSILAGEIAAVFGAHEQIPLLYEKQDRKKPFDLATKVEERKEESRNGSEENYGYMEQSNNSYFSENNIEELRDSSGILTRSGRYLAASSQYLGPRQTTTSSDYVHFGLGIAAGFAGVARPFDDMRHVMNQWQLTTVLATSAMSKKKSNDQDQDQDLDEEQEHEQEQKEPWRLLGPHELQLIHDTRISPRAYAMSQLEIISQRYWALKWLEQEVSNFGGYFVFRCIVVSSNTAYPDFARAYCLELGFEVDIMLPPPPLPPSPSPSPSEDILQSNNNNNTGDQQEKRQFTRFFDKIKRNKRDINNSNNNNNNSEFYEEAEQSSDTHEEIYNSQFSKLEGGEVELDQSFNLLEKENRMMEKDLEKAYEDDVGYSSDNVNNNNNNHNNKNHEYTKTVLKAGDRIISTAILELDPTSGHLVLGI